MSGWDFWIDRGGTFTDVVARDPKGEISTRKLLSANPEQYEDAALAAMRGFLGLGRDDLIQAAAISSVKMGTTVATNALLERAGEPLALIITRGLGDQLRLGLQARPKLFERHIKLPSMLYSHVIEADERLRADGTVEQPLDEAALARDLAAAYEKGGFALDETGEPGRHHGGGCLSEPDFAALHRQGRGGI